MLGLNRDKGRMDLAVRTFIIFLILQLYAVTPSRGESQSKSLLTFLRHFNATRNNWIDPDNTQLARDVIMNTFSKYGMVTWKQEFSSDNRLHYGYNIVAQLNGRYTGSRDDKIVVIGAHYDTVRFTPGVDDNGSGVVALLQIAKQLHSTDILNCQRKYTLQLVAFDLTENHSCAGAAGDRSCGSYEFIQNLTESMNRTGASLQGAFVIDTIMNYNATNHSQEVHSQMGVWFPAQYIQLQADNFRGDFVEAIGRRFQDTYLLGNFSRQFSQTDKFKVQVKDFELPVRPSQLAPNLLKDFAHLFRSDHYRFWDSEPPLNAILLSDTAYYRGHMVSCYHGSCDDIAHVTEDMLVFLGKTADALVGSAQEMTQAHCEVKSKECGREWNGPSGQFQSPSYPDMYPNSLSCQWLVTGPADHFVTLTFTDFELENSVDCKNDFVEVKDGDGTSGSSVIGRLCGSKSQVSFNSSGASVRVLFQSDAFVAFKGFNVTWSSHPMPRPAARSQADLTKSLHGTWIVVTLLMWLNVLFGMHV